jgi:hypothetical protein
VRIIHIALVQIFCATERIHSFVFFVGRGPAGMFRCWMVQVQMMKIERQFLTIVIIPRTPGPDTKLVLVGGRVHIGLKLVAPV